MLKFYKCPHCGNLIAMIKDSSVVPVCCGDQMMELKAGVSDGAFEKHVPVFTIDGCKVKVNVGEVNHPMTAAHLIEWIAIETNQGCALKHLTCKGLCLLQPSWSLAEGCYLVKWLLSCLLRCSEGIYKRLFFKGLIRILF